MPVFAPCPDWLGAVVFTVGVQHRTGLGGKKNFILHSLAQHGARDWRALALSNTGTPRGQKEQKDQLYAKRKEPRIDATAQGQRQYPLSWGFGPLTENPVRIE